jgi:putative peptide zinc metalloprotease protein
MCEYLRGGAGEGPSGTAGRPSSLPAASDSSRSASPSLSAVPEAAVPEAAVPESTVSEVSVPEVSVPEVSVPEAPRLALGVELLGEFKNSGYSPPPFLVRRPDGQVIQMSRLLYLVAALINGIRSAAVIAELASADLGRSLGADQVRYIITAKLLPLGLIAGPGAPAAPPTASPLLALRARGTLLPETATNVVAALLRPLFRWQAVLAVVFSVAAVDWWLLATHQLALGLDQLLRDPATLLIVFVLSVASAAFHECGHATACRYGGARPGKIGAGIYLVWPSFFTNVTDSYRLGRGARLRTDLGGLYFNLIFILGLAVLYEATSARILLLVIAVTHLEMLQQLLPFVRFDGYFILSDIVGVPDLFARVTPILKSVRSKGRTDPRVAGLRRGARIAVTSWVLCVVPLLTFTVGYLLLCLPQINRALWRATVQQARLAGTAISAHHYAIAALDAIGVALAALSVVGSLYIVIGLTRRAVMLGLRWSADRPVRRLVVAVVAAAIAASLATLWASQGEFRGW